MKYRARRRLTSFEVILHSDRGRQRADIVDITECGARLRLSMGNLDPESEISMDIRGCSHAARVVWNKEGEAGVAFQKILPLDVLSAINRSLHKADAPKKRRFLMP